MRCKACNAILGDLCANRTTGELEDLCTRCRQEVKDALKWQEYCQNVYGDGSIVYSPLEKAFADDYAEDRREVLDEYDYPDRNSEELGADRDW